MPKCQKSTTSFKRRRVQSAEMFQKASRDPIRKEAEVRFRWLVLDRVAHDEALVERAKKAGARVPRWRQGKEVSGRDAVLSDGRTIQADIIVRAGGIWILSEGPCGLRRH